MEDNSMESHTCRLEDNQEMQGVQVGSADKSKDPSTCPYCGKKYIYLRSLLRHKTLCAINKCMTPKSSKPQLKEESSDSDKNEIGSGDNVNDPDNGLEASTSVKRKFTFDCKKVEKETGRKPKICELCNEKLKRMRDLRRHWLALHFHIYGDNSPKNFPCSDCEQSFTTETFKNAHFRAIHRGLTPYRCLLCRKNFGTLSTYQKHIAKSHVKDGDTSCGLCTEKFCDQETLDLHKRIIHDNNHRPHICSICQKGFRTSAGVKTHEANHLVKKSFRCELCSGSFITSEKLESHQRKFHHEELNLEPLICEKCPKLRFGNETEAKNHQQSKHTTTFNFYCTKCPRGFVRADGLQYHMDTKHPPGKNFACSYCGKCFQTHTKRYLHIRSFHNDTYTFQCATCPKKFKDKKVLDKHNRHVHTETERVKCPHCPLMFKLSKYLEEHIRNKHDENGGRKVVKNIPCPHCSMMFSDKSYLINHVKKKHPEEDLLKISLPTTSTAL